MASERDKAKKSITRRDSNEPELDDALTQAHALQHKLALQTEDNRHREAMRVAELGWVGRIIGGEATASLTVAFIVVCSGLISAAWCLAIAAYSSTAAADFWAKQSERSVAVTMTALSYIFGKSPGRSSK
jgi:hypothetical protein